MKIEGTTLQLNIDIKPYVLNETFKSRFGSRHDQMRPQPERPNFMPVLKSRTTETVSSTNDSIPFNS